MERRFLPPNHAKVVEALCVEVRREGHKHCSVKWITAGSFPLAGVEVLLPVSQAYCYILNYSFTDLFLRIESLLFKSIIK